MSTALGSAVPGTSPRGAVPMHLPHMVGALTGAGGAVPGSGERGVGGGEGGAPAKNGRLRGPISTLASMTALQQLKAAHGSLRGFLMKHWRCFELLDGSGDTKSGSSGSSGRRGRGAKGEFRVRLKETVYSKADGGTSTDMDIDSKTLEQYVAAATAQPQAPLQFQNLTLQLIDAIAQVSGWVGRR